MNKKSVLKKHNNKKTLLKNRIPSSDDYLRIFKIYLT